MEHYTASHLYADIYELALEQYSMMADMHIKFRSVLCHQFNDVQAELLNALTEIRMTNKIRTESIGKLNETFNRIALYLEIGNRLKAISGERFGTYLERHVRLERRLRSWKNKNDKKPLRRNNKLGFSYLGVSPGNAEV